jgi:alpha-tubulin suppressor-like RCC1 family protein/predicted cupin superfamily sugar epimerase
VAISTATAGASIRYTTDGSTPTAASGLAYSSPIALPLNSTTTIKAVAYLAGWSDSPVSAGTWTVTGAVTGTVAAPVFSVAPGTYTTAQSVAISTATAGASIRYTTDGSTPTAASGLPYSAPIALPLNSTTTIKAVAYRGGWSDSPVSAGSWTVTGTVATPAFSVAPGSYTTAQSVTITSATPGASIRYTTDGSTPTAASGLPYSAPIALPLNSTTTIKAVAYLAGWSDSPVSAGSWTVTGTVAAPAFSVAPGSYTTAQSVTITSATPGASIRYTTDGSTPTSTYGTVYFSPIALPLNSTTTIKAVAYLAGWSDSPVSAGSWTVTGTVATPAFSVAPGTYTTAQVVAISTATAGAVIRYTLDNTDPTPFTGTVYSTPVALPLASVTRLKAVAYKADWGTSAIASGTYTVTGTVAAPAFSPPPGSYATAQSVTLSSTTAGASIRYTTDGSEPTSLSGIAYTGPFTVSSSAIVRAIAYKADWLDSPLASATYTINGAVATPTFGLPPGSYTTAQSVAITSATTGASIRYTTDGSTPTATSGLIYSSPIALPLNSTTTIKAVAYLAGWTDSPVTAGTWTVTGTVAAPAFSVAPGSYTTAQSVAITTATAGASIRYTTDGSTPTAASGLPYSAPIALPLNSTTTIKAVAYKAGWSDSPVSAGSWTVTGTVAAPSFSVAPGSYTTAQSVTITSATTGASIRYTTDGSTPTSTYGTAYSSPIALPLNSNTTIKAVAYLAGWSDSPVSAGSWTVTGTVAAPSFSVAPGTYTTAQSVAITSATPGASIRYTTDGSTPTSTYGTVYSSPIALPLNSTTTIKAVAYLAGWGDSPVSAGTWTVTGTVATPAFSVAPGSYTTAQSVTITSATPGASIRYTTDGSTPTSTYGTVYFSPIALPLNSTTTIKAVAYLAGWSDSPVSAGSWTVTGTVATPAFSVAPGTYTTAQVVAISTATAGAVIRYTLDNTDPTPFTGTVYSTPVALPLASVTRLKAVAYKADWGTSAIASGTYTVTGTVAAPAFSPPPGSYATAQSVTLSSTTAGASIRYTTDGSNPTATSGLVYSSPIALPPNSSTTIRAIAYMTGWADSAVASGAYTVTGTVAAPAFSPLPGSYATAQSVTLSSTTAGASIRYTTDGSTPTAAYGTVYSAPIALAEGTTATIRAIAYKAGWADSAVASGAYTVTGTVAAPAFSPLPGSYATAQSVTLSSATAGASIRYTTDGSTPTPAYGTVYSAPIALAEGTTATIRAIAYKAGWGDSPVSAGSYTISGTVAAPVFSPPPGTYAAPGTVTISTTTAGAAIRYTLDNTTPTPSHGTVYSAPVPVATTTLKAVAFKAGMADSPVTTGAYSLGSHAVTALAAGASHTVAVKADGSAWAWGANSLGQLGDNTTLSRLSPVRVSVLSGVASIAAGNFHTLAVRSDGTAWGWGFNGSSQLGDGTTIQRPAPVRIPGLENVVMVAAGAYHSVALSRDGSVWAWGGNDSGQLGDGTLVNRPAPVRLAITGVASIAAGAYHTVAVKADGTVWAWGDNYFGQLGDGRVLNSPDPLQVGQLSGMVSAAAGDSHTVVLKGDGTVWAWGDNYSGQLGDGTMVNSYRAVQVAGLAGVASIAAGDYHTVARKADGTAWGWGDNLKGQIGDGSDTVRPVPVQVAGITGAVAVAAGSGHSVAGKGNGTVWAWGDNYDGQLGNGAVRRCSSPVTVTGTGGTSSVAARYFHTASVKADGTVSTWGDNYYGQLGDGTTTERSVPIPVGGLSGVTRIAAGRYHTVALKGNGSVWVWGDNYYGQLGDGTTTDRYSPVPVNGLPGAIAVSAGRGHTVVLLADGTVRTWGDNYYGQLGDGTTTNRSTPVVVPGLSGVVAVSAGDSHTVALKGDGTVWCWGSNGYGQLGDGTGTPRTAPVQVVGLSGISAVAAGSTHSVAVKNDGTVWGWGSNAYSQLGDGTTTQRFLPVRATGLSGAVSVAAGAGHTVAVRGDGTVWAWGANQGGQLGIGSSSPTSAVPLPVPAVTGAVSAAAADSHSVVVTADGSVYTWGTGDQGQLGLGPATSPLPAQTIAAGGTPFTGLLSACGSFAAAGAGGGGGGCAAVSGDGGSGTWVVALPAVAFLVRAIRRRRKGGAPPPDGPSPGGAGRPVPPCGYRPSTSAAIASCTFRRSAMLSECPVMRAVTFAWSRRPRR